jgi:CheY-like chemotaxis protein
MAKKILLVDDSSTTLMMEQMILSKRTQYTLLTARDGQEAVEKATREMPDLILMDVIMPRMNGYEACKEIRRRPGTQQIPVIMVTTRGEPENVETGYAAGCSDYITKPINSVELVTKIHSFLGE